jgi:riboflavin biosynthesis pyrimidine reductase
LLEGSGSFVLPGAAPDPLPAVEAGIADLDTDYLPPAIVDQPGRRWMAVVDGRGRGRWLYKEFPGEDWAGFYLLILVSRATPAEYLAYLRRESIPYLVCGAEQQVDLRVALDKMATRLGVDCVVSTAGGRLNGALLRQGLVDEIELEFFPAVIGGRGTPALFDAEPLGPEEIPTRLERLDCQALPNGAVRLHYRVVMEIS